MNFFLTGFLFNFQNKQKVQVWFLEQKGFLSAGITSFKNSSLGLKPGGVFTSSADRLSRVCLFFANSLSDKKAFFWTSLWVKGQRLINTWGRPIWSLKVGQTSWIISSERWERREGAAEDGEITETRRKPERKEDEHQASSWAATCVWWNVRRSSTRSCSR